MTAPAAAPAVAGAAVVTQTALSVVASTAASAVQTAMGTLEIRDLAKSLPGFAALIAAIIDRYGRGAATLAAQQYAAQRATAGIASRFTTTVAPPPPLQQSSVMVSWATQPLWANDPAVDAAERNLVAGVEKLVLDSARDTIVTNVKRDPKAVGWVRVAEPDPCYFCALLVQRGPAYKHDTASFRSHNHCRCHGEPIFGPYEPSAQVREWRKLYRDATSGNAAQIRREWRKAFDAAYPAK